MSDFGRVFARLLHCAGTTTLFGAWLFAVYAHAGTESEALQHRRARLPLWAAVLGMLSCPSLSLGWLVFSAANMSGSLSDLANPRDRVGSHSRCALRDCLDGPNSVLAWIVIALITVRPVGSKTIKRGIVVSILSAIVARQCWRLRWCWRVARSLSTYRLSQTFVLGWPRLGLRTR